LDCGVQRTISYVQGFLLRRRHERNEARISQFLYDLNVGPSDQSGATTYLAAGYSNRIPVPGIFPDLDGAYTIDADGIVPLSSALGFDPFTGQSLFPGEPMIFNAAHTKLPHLPALITQF
jgi:hypothetical protein